MSADLAHKKGRRQYQAEKQKKRKVTEKVAEVEETPKKKSKVTARNSVSGIATGSRQSAIRHTC